MPMPYPLTRELAAAAVNTRFEALPEAVQRESSRAFLNWMGCVLGGCQEPAVKVSVLADGVMGAQGPATVVGHAHKADWASAAFINCLSSSILAFDDTHLSTVTHPTGPVAAALLACAQTRAVTGTEFANALVLGIEIQCRMSKLLLHPPATSHLGFYITGLTAPMGVAAAVGRVLQLDVDRMAWALGLAASQAAGFRSTHGSMAGGFVPAHAARCGVSAAVLASQGFTCTPTSLEAARGFLDVFSVGVEPDHALAGYGEHFEMLANAYKPYPCGIVVHPAIDASLALAGQCAGRTVQRVQVHVHPLGVSLADRPQPVDGFEAMVSLQHWVAAALVTQQAGLTQARQACIDGPAIRAVRDSVQLQGDASLGRDEAFVQLWLEDGTTLQAHVPHARGSLARPMTDAELDAKFDLQARDLMSSKACQGLREQCHSLALLTDVGEQLGALLPT